jgi:hypothetical protein
MKRSKKIDRRKADGFKGMAEAVELISLNERFSDETGLVICFAPRSSELHYQLDYDLSKWLTPQLEEALNENTQEN